MDNKISIITTVSNEEKNIAFLIESLLQQALLPDEIVINDNGSVDKTVEIVKKYQVKHHCIKLIEGNGKSIGEGRNKAIEKSSGDILAIMDSGIYPEKDWLEKVTAPLLTDQKIDIAWGHVIFDTKSRVIPSSNIALALVFLTKYPENREKGKNVTTSAFRRRVWEELGKFPEIKIPIEDLLLIDVLARKGFKTVHVNNAIAYYFNYPASQYEVFKKWITSACSSFVVKKSELGFFRQLIVFGVFFIALFMTIIDIRLMVLVFLYIVVFFAIKTKNNMELGKKVLCRPKLLTTTLSLFFVLNFARLLGVIKALILITTGKVPKYQKI